MSFIKSAGDNYNPHKLDNLLIASRPGMSKTSLSMQLPNSILFDLEGSSGYFKGNGQVIDIKQRMAEEKCGMLTAITRTITEIQESKIKYKFGIIDTISILDELADAVATAKYKKTVPGKDFKGGSILELGFGAGYILHRIEFQAIIDLFSDVAETKIYLAHVKDSSIPKDGSQVAVTDIRLTGALKEIFSSKQDAACTLEVDSSNKNIRILDFEKTDQSSLIKCRVEHLAGNKIIISNKTDKGLETYWDKIFLDLKKTK